jgi:hypothetical protein
MITGRCEAHEEHGKGQQRNGQEEYYYAGDDTIAHEEPFGEASGFSGFAENELGTTPQNTESDDLTDIDEAASKTEYDIFGDNVEEANQEQNNASDQEGVEHLSQEDIQVFLENESVAAAQNCSQEVRSHHAP